MSALDLEKEENALIKKGKISVPIWSHVELSLSVKMMWKLHIDTVIIVIEALTVFTVLWKYLLNNLSYD